MLRQPIQCDPLVSDTACHTRAPYLIYLSRKKNNLSVPEKTYLENCDLLTAIQDREYDAFGIIKNERTDIKKIPDRYSGKNNSNTKKNTLLAETRSLVANSTLDFLFANTEKLTLDQNRDAFTFHIPSCRQKIPVIPLYYSAKMMLHYAAQQNIPFVVNLKQLNLEGNTFQLNGAISMPYFYDAGTTTFVAQEAQHQETEAIAIDMVSYYVKDRENEVNNFLASGTFQTFLELFKQQDLATLVMICAVGHPQYPASATNNQGEGLPTQNNEETLPPQPNFKVDLNQCNNAEKQQLRALAKHYGFFRENARYGASTCLFFIDHVRAATISQCQTEMQQLHQQALKR